MRSALPALLLAATVACGGGGPSEEPPPSPPPSNSNPVSPCAAALTAGADTPSAGPRPSATGASKPADGLDQSTRWRVLEDLWIHRQAQRGQPTDRQAQAGAPVSGVDIGAIAVLQDEGDLLVPPNVLDLRGTGLRFTPNGDGGYDARVTDASFRATLGTRLTLEDDDAERVDVPFAFPFYGQTAYGELRELGREHHLRGG